MSGIFTFGLKAIGPHGFCWADSYSWSLALFCFRSISFLSLNSPCTAPVVCCCTQHHTQRPTAKEALRHPWLSPAFHEAKRRPLSATVVQRIQRFAQNNALRRTILELIAQVGGLGSAAGAFGGGCKSVLSGVWCSARSWLC